MKDFNLFNTIDHILRILNNPPSFFNHIIVIGLILILIKNTNIMNFSNNIELIIKINERTNIFNQQVVNNEYYQEIIVRNSKLGMDFIDNSMLMCINPNRFVWNYIKNWLIQYINNPINYGVLLIFQWLSYRLYFSIRVRNFSQDILRSRLNWTQERINNPLTRRSLSFFLYFYNRTFPILSRLLFRNFK
jgi:hypothetical protein